MTCILGPNAGESHILMFQVEEQWILVYTIAGLVLDSPNDGAHKLALNPSAALLQHAVFLQQNHLVARSSRVLVQKPYHGGLQERWSLRALSQMHQNDLGRVHVVRASMPMTTICARMRAMYATEVQTLGVVAVGVGLGPSASWGSWYILRQTHERSHVDGAGKQAKLCIYLMASRVDSHLCSSLAVRMKEVPSDGSKLMEKTVLVERIVTVIAVCLEGQWAAVVYSSRS